MSGIVYLVGTGPGDEGLITVKGLECIKTADVVVYDRLIPNALLKYCKEEVEFIFVGKSPEKHTLTQEEINHVLVTKANEGKQVTRLKGGDPFVFGRGGEEAQTLVEAGITFEPVPGITSAVAAPMYAGIPVTHRGVSSSVSVITGHEDPQKQESAISWNELAAGGDTLCFLMGVGNIDKIADNLISQGRSPSTPVALVRWGTRPYQSTLTGTLENIAEKVRDAGFTAPAVIVIGHVVNLRQQLSWFEHKPLFNKRVLVTRSRSQASDLSNKILQLGGEALEFPTIKITDPTSYAPLDAAIEKLESYHWLAFTSVNGVSKFFERLFYLGYDVRKLGRCKICAIGTKTQEVLADRGISVDVVPSEFRAEALIEALSEQIKSGEKLLLPRAKEAREVLPNTLRELGVDVHVKTAYETVRDGGDIDNISELIKEGSLDAITFTSSSTVHNFVNLLTHKSLSNEQLQSYLATIHIACIGPITAETCESYGIEVDSVAQSYTIPGLVDSLVDTLGNRS